ncbi:MAG: outer membrane protein assembly factor BamB [Limisphaerales bacterium]|jgi:outer membrane protein assembly factor BamB
MKLFLSCALLLATGTFLSAGPQDWPQFRGIKAAGVATGFATPTNWNVPAGTQVRWKTRIPGLAHSSPIIWGDRVYLQTAQGEGDAALKVGLYGKIASVDEKDEQRWRLLAIDKTTGAIVWDTLALEGLPRVKRHTKATHCNSTPATDGQRIVALFGSEGLFCFDTAGKFIWKQDLGPMDSGYYKVKTAQWGFAGSPIIHDGRVIIQCDVQEDSFVAAYDLKDGKELWRTARKDVPTWSTPAIHQDMNRTQIILNGWHHSGGYDFVTGRELWKLSGGGDIPVPTPVFGHGYVYLTSAHGRSRPMRALRLDATGDITPDNVASTNDTIVWTHARKGNYMQTPIVVGNNLYGCSDLGILTCFDARTGTIHYEERLEKGRSGFTASPVSANGNLYLTSENGAVFVVPATREFSITAINPLGETCLATSAISEGTLFFRTRHHLIAIGGE